MAAAVSLIGAFLLMTADAEARTRKQRPVGGWHAGFAAIVIDAKTGKILDEDKPDALRHPASLTKIMTLYVLFERIEQGKFTLKTRLNVSENASEQPPSKLGLQPGTTIAVEDAIKALVTRSANDVAVVIAENIADDEDAFAELMTRKARALGMTNTVFKNASGLPDRAQVTTARDMATLGRAIQDRYPVLYRYFSTQSFVWRGRVIANHNRLLGRVAGVDGIKTGYTNASGFNLVTSVRHKNRHVVAVVLGGRTGAQRDQYMRELISDNLDDASPAQRTAPLIVEAAPPAPVKTAQVKQQPQAQAQTPAPQQQRVVRAPATKQQVVVAAGSNDPIRPVAVKTMPLNADGKTMPPKTASANLFALSFSNFSAAHAVPSQLTPNTGEQVVIVENETPQPQPNAQPAAVAQTNAPQAIAAQANAALTNISTPLAFASAQGHSAHASQQALAQAQVQTQVQQQVQAQAPAKNEPQLSETEELELEARALAATRGEPEPAPAPAQTKNAPRKHQVASTASIPVAAPADDEADALPPAAKTGWSIQVGAYPDAKQAKERLDDAKSSATALLAKTSPYTEKISKGSTNLFRARFAGFQTEWQARRACQQLQRSRFDCIVAKN